MPLPWVRLDTAMPDHPKILQLCEEGDAGMAAAFVWACSLAYAGKHGTGGFIPRSALARCNGKAKHATKLVKARLWEEADGGWLIHDWEDFNMVAMSLEELQANAAAGGRARAAKLTPEQRSEIARKAARVRWDGE